MSDFQSLIDEVVHAMADGLMVLFVSCLVVAFVLFVLLRWRHADRVDTLQTMERLNAGVGPKAYQNVLRRRERPKAEIVRFQPKRFTVIRADRRGDAA